LEVYTHARESDKAYNQSLKPTVKTTMVLLIQYWNTTSIHNNGIIYNYKSTTKQLKTTTKQLQHDYKIHQNNYKTTRKKLEYDYGVAHHGWKYGKWMNRLWIFDEKV
jgi:hypothetical protein